MIRIHRPPRSPDILQDAGEQHTEENRELYILHMDEFDSGSKKFPFERVVYGHRSVKDTLLLAQFDRCCYCESKFGATSFGAVEHFRPKGAVRQERGHGLEYPGYFWLAYSWDNPVVSCEKCNSGYKGSFFPLANPENRARNHLDDICIERPLFVDPARENPRHHMRFRGASIEPLTTRGRETICGLGLRRPGLGEARMERLGRLKTLRFILELEGKVDDHEISSARKELDEAVLPRAKYAAMARDFLENNVDSNEGG